MSTRWLFSLTFLLICCLCLPAVAQVETTAADYFGTLLSPSSDTITREILITDNVHCIATWLTREYYIVRKVRELIDEGLSSKEANKVMKEMFETEVPTDLLEIYVTFRWTPDGPEYTLPGNIASGVVLHNEQGVRVEGTLKEKLVSNLTLQKNWEYRSMLLDFKRYLTRGKDDKKVDILENTKTITLDLPYVTKAGKPISFTWAVSPRYPHRPLEMAKLVDFRHNEFKIVW